MRITEERRTTKKNSNAQPEEEQPEPQYEVERILDHRKMGRSYDYFVHWLGYPSSDDSWIPTTNMTKGPLLTQYWKDQKKIKSQPTENIAKVEPKTEPETAPQADESDPGRPLVTETTRRRPPQPWQPTPRTSGIGRIRRVPFADRLNEVVAVRVEEKRPVVVERSPAEYMTTPQRSPTGRIGPKPAKRKLFNIEESQPSAIVESPSIPAPNTPSPLVARKKSGAHVQIEDSVVGDHVDDSKGTLILKPRKLIRPETPTDGLRRSKRTRMAPARSWAGEQPVYESSPGGGKTLVGTNRVVVRDPRHIRMRTMDPIKALDRERHQSRDGPPSPEPPGWVLRNYKEVQQSIVFEF